MDKMYADFAAETHDNRTTHSDSQYSSAGSSAKGSTESRLWLQPYRGASSVPQDSAGDRVLREDDRAAISCIDQMRDFARRIEESAENSSSWDKIGGSALTRLRVTFRGLLWEILDKVDNSSGAVREQYEIARTSRNGDLVLGYRFAAILSSTINLSAAGMLARVEVGCSSLSTDFTCFLGERSAGVTVRKNDNLFALCANGEWHAESTENMPLFGSIRRVVQSLGGQMCTDTIEGTTIKVSFPIEL